jgi:hypothetical protein
VFFAIREIAAATGGRFDIASLAAAYRKLIPALPSAGLTNGRHQLSGNRFEAAGFMQPVRFNPGTGRFVYFDAPRPVT